MSVIKVTAVNANIGSQSIVVAPGGAVGPQGPVGQGVAAGGTIGQALVKIDGTDYNTQWSDVASTAADVTVTDSGGYFTGTDVEAVLQEIGATPGLEGWEIAQLTEGTGGTIWSDNRTELQRAYNTGTHVYVAPGTYEIDDCVLTGQSNLYIWANNVTFKWAADPSIVSRSTESMIEVGQSHTNIELRGRITFDGNEGLSYTNNNSMVFIDGTNSGTLGHFIAEDLTFKNESYRAFFLTTTKQTADFTYARIGSVKLIDAVGITGFRFRTRIEQGVTIDDLSAIETGGDKPNKWNDIGYGNMRPAFIFELGEISIPSSHTQYIRTNRIHLKYPKYSGYGASGVKTHSVGEYIVENAFWNEDGTDATMSSPGTVLAKNGSLIVSDEIRASYKVYFDRIIVRGTNNGKAIPVQGG